MQNNHTHARLHTVIEQEKQCFILLSQLWIVLFKVMIYQRCIFTCSGSNVTFGEKTETNAAKPFCRPLIVQIHVGYVGGCACLLISFYLSAEATIILCFVTSATPIMRVPCFSSTAVGGKADPPVLLRTLSILRSLGR